MGVLGAARIAPKALLVPAKDLPEVTVTAIAARELARAERFAKRHGVARTHASYHAVIDDPDIDAVYIPLPNGLHAEWTLRAIAAGKHVLCEKPFTSNASEAREVAAAADQSGLVVMEAFHYRYHALAERMRAITHDGTIGRVSRISTSMCFPLPRFSDIRYRWDLAGGAMMDAGCYAIHCLRLLGNGEPTVLTAEAKTAKDPRVDRAMVVRYEFADGVSGQTTVSMWSRKLLGLSARAVGDRGEMRVTNFVLPQLFNRLKVTVDGKTSAEKVSGEPSYTAQLRAFVGAVLRGEPVLTPASDAVITMSLIDDVYRAAGLPVRGAA